MLQEQSKLLSLSDEVILLILGLTSNPVLIVIAKTCRRLYYLALPVYFQRYGIPSNPAPRSLVLCDRTLRALPGLTAAFFITSVDDLLCKFPGPEEYCFSKGVRDLHRFVYRLSSVSSVSLDISNIDTRWTSGLATAVSDAWKPRFIRLLDTMLERGCSSLTVAYGHFNVAPSLLTRRRVEEPKAERKFLGRVPLLSLFRRKQASKVNMRAGSKLSSLCIHSNMLLSPPFYEWTLQTLHANPITSLSFRVSGLSQDAWARLLSALTLPSLASFSPENSGITFPALLAFLQRHPTITTLNLHPHVPHACSRLPKPKSQDKENNLLPRLVALGGCPKNVTALLSHLHPDTALRVQKITLVLHMDQHVFHPSDFAALSAQIVDVVKGKGVRPTSLALRFLVPYEMLHPPLALENDGRSLRELSGSVTTLAFSTDGQYAFARWVMPRLPAWLGANFVQLRNVWLTEDCVAGVQDVCGVVQSIKECTGVENVVLRDMVT
ncbi:hypothetical protein C0989_009899 [Termitomyces sp. Mn162]|nr:hypothetical protein C0989_009899 [Termitomyces sp. Mn162]